MRGLVIDILSQMEEQFCSPSEYPFDANNEALELWLVLMLDMSGVCEKGFPAAPMVVIILVFVWDEVLHKLAINLDAKRHSSNIA
jgi:hypothetical protein